MPQLQRAMRGCAGLGGGGQSSSSATTPHKLSSRSKRCLIVQAADGAQGPGAPGTVNRPAGSPGPMPNLQPLPPRQGMAAAPPARPGLPPNDNAAAAGGPAGLQRPSVPQPPPPPPGGAAAQKPSIPPQQRPGGQQLQRPSLTPPPPPSQPQAGGQQQLQRPGGSAPAAATPPPAAGGQTLTRPGAAAPGGGQQQQQLQRPGLQPLAKPGMPLQRPQMPAAGGGAGAAAGAGAGLSPRPVLPQQGSSPAQQQQQGLNRPSMPPPAGGVGAGAAAVRPQPPALQPKPLQPLTRPGAPTELNRPMRPQQQSQQQQQQGAAGGAGAGSVQISLNRVSAATAASAAAAAAAQDAAAEQREAPRATGRLGRFEVIEEDEDVELDDDEEGEGGEKGKGKGKKGKKGRKEKVTAEMKRAARKMREAERQEKAAAARREAEEIFEVGDEGMSLEALADAIQVDPSDIVRTLFMKGIMLSLNQVLDKNTVKLVASEFDLLVIDKEEVSVTDAAKKSREFLELDDLDHAEPRPPVVTVMGHVDHGKTSLLDHIRKAKVAAGEAGGITQAIGAYNVEVEVDATPKTICFFDTPGHEAFSAMRARGARVTDIAIIIVAADDGVQPQTREAVSHAQAAEVPIIVAINKIDKPGADIERTKQGLLELNLVPEEWGGNTPMVPVSAKKGTGIDDLLQTVLWVAEEKALMANPSKLAAGTVIEAHLDKKRGPVATLLVQAGTLKVGDVVSAGATHGKVRSLNNAAGVAITSAGPSIAVQLIGLNAVPQAGDEFQAHATDSEARNAAEEASEGLRAARIAEMSTTGSMVTLSSLATMDEDADTLQRMNLIIKGDTSGVVEAIKGALQGLPQESVVLRYLLSAAGDITTSDVDLAAASGGMVVGFNLSPDENVLAHAKHLGVTINTYKVIYNLIDDVKAAMEGKLRAVEEKQPLGEATVKAIFGTGKKKVAGCLVDSGKLAKGAMIEVVRGSGKDKATVFAGKLASLRRIKDSVEEVQSGLECGVAAEDWTSWQEGDVINCYKIVTKSQRLEEAKATTAVDLATLGVS